MKKLSMLLIFIFLFLYIFPLGVRPLVIPDESRYAEIAREMLETGDFVVPRLNGLRYFEKPVMGHWLNAASIKVFGENEFAVRFTSACSVGLSALMLFFLARRFAGSYFSGLVSSMIFLTCFEVFVVGVFSVLDSMFSFFITAAIICFYYAYSNSISDRLGPKNIFLLCCGIFIGFAFLTKGFLAIVLPVIIMTPFLIWEKRWKDLFTAPWIPLAAAVLVVLPWVVMIHLKEPDFWNYFFWEEHFKRFSTDNAQHKEPFFHYLLYFPAAAVPWTFLLPAAGFGFHKIKHGNPIIKFAICWFLFPFLFFSVSKGKLLTYILPCFVPFALLVATGLLNSFEIGTGKKADIKFTIRFQTGAFAAAGFFFLLAVVLITLQSTDVFHFKPFIQQWKYLLSVSVCLSTVVLYLVAAKREDIHKKIMLFVMAPLLFLLTVHFLYLDTIIPNKSPGAFLMKHSAKIRSDTVIVSSHNPIKAVCWYYKRRDVYIVGTTGELTYGVQYQDSAQRLLGLDRVNELIDENPGNLVIIASDQNFEGWKSELPEPVFADRNGEFVFAMY